MGISYIEHLGTFAFMPVLLLILEINLALTLIHSRQERKGKLWGYFGAIVGVHIPDRVGIVLFFWLLTLSLWMVGVIGIAGLYLFPLLVSPVLAVTAIGVMLGARVFDSLISHLLLENLGYCKNPGLKSVPFYLAEAIMLAIVFLPGLQHYPDEAITGFAVGAAIFILVLPLLWPLHFIPALSCDRWQRDKPQPKCEPGEKRRPMLEKSKLA